MAGSGHHKKDDERQEAQDLKGKLRNAGIACVAGEQAGEWIQVTKAVKLDEREQGVSESSQKRGDTEVPAVVE